MDKYQVLYMDSKGVRHLIELPEISDRIEVIGVTRFTDFDAAAMSNDGWDMNGSYPVISGETFNDVFGKVLTIVDASFQDGSQKDAFKSLVKSTMSEWYNKNVDYVSKMTAQGKPYPVADQPDN